MRKSIIISLTIIAVLSAGAITTYNFYAPLTSGTSGQILVSAGPNANPTWLPDTKTRVTLNGESKAGSAIDIYAPTTYGTAGQVLISSGYGIAPSWGVMPWKSQQATKSSGVTGTVWCYRSGPIVTLVFDQFTVSSSGTLSGCLTIPYGYRPTQWLLGGLVTTSCTVGGVNINPDTGVTQLFGSKGTIYFGCVTYFTSNAMP